MHIPVLLHEVLQHLDPKPGEFIIDGTINGGGHSAEIFAKLLPGGKLLGIDLDGNHLETARLKILTNIKRRTPGIEHDLMLVHGNYTDIPVILKEKNLSKADGLILDLGFSSEQLESGRGFSFMKNEELRMTYNDSETPVKEILKSANERDLAKIIFDFSGEKYSLRIAKAIAARRKKKQIETTGELREIIERAVPKNYERGRINPATRTFQALRIYANHELENLEKALNALSDMVNKNGKVVIVSFHSLEDRIVKQKFRESEQRGTLEILTKKPVVASEEEIESNPRSRSAKLRAARIIT